MKVSLVMAVYNGEKYLIEQLDSIRKQTYLIDEVILIDGQGYYGFDQNGCMVLGWQVYHDKFNDSDHWMYFDQDGLSHNGWLELNGKKYYLNPITGYMVSNETVKIDNDYYKFNENGELV